MGFLFKKSEISQNINDLLNTINIQGSPEFERSFETLIREYYDIFALELKDNETSSLAPFRLVVDES